MLREQGGEARRAARTKRIEGTTPASPPQHHRTRARYSTRVSPPTSTSGPKASVQASFLVENQSTFSAMDGSSSGATYASATRIPSASSTVSRIRKPVTKKTMMEPMAIRWLSVRVSRSP